MTGAGIARLAGLSLRRATRRARLRPVTTRWRRLALWKKVAAVGIVVVLAVVGTAGGVYAAWNQAKPQPSGSQSTGMVTSTFVNTGANTWTTPIPVLNPGDYLYRYLAITNTGTVTQSFTLSVAGGTDWAYPGGDTALQITVATCAVAWVTGTPPTCQGGAGTSVVAKSSVAAVNPSRAFTVGTLAASAVAYLQVRLEFPATATSASWDNTGTVTVTEAGTQRSGNDRSAG